MRDGRTGPSRLTIAHTDFLMLKLQAFAALGVALLAAAFYVVWFFGVMTTVTPEAAGLDVGSSNISRLSVGYVTSQHLQNLPNVFQVHCQKIFDKV